MIRPLVQVGNPIIRTKAKEVGVKAIGTKKMQNLIRDLIDSMRAHELVGIAAPQIGVGLRVFVTEIRRTKLRKTLKELDGVRVYINPRLVEFSKKKTVLYEGCGSLVCGQLFGSVRRPEKLTVKATNEKGQVFEIAAQGLLAKVIQHEFDHLQGMVCIDKFVDMRKVMEKEEYLGRLI